jgi:DNA repair photolyase
MKCKHECSYCWATALKEGRLKNSRRYRNLNGLIDARRKMGDTDCSAMLMTEELSKRFRAGDYVFVEDMGDLFGSWVPEPWIYEVMEVIEQCPKADFLLLTKNPWRMLEYKFPENVLCGATIETTRSVRAWSKAPAPCNRFRAMKMLEHPHKAIIIEPIMDFDLKMFVAWLDEIHPELIVVGYDNYHNHLEEPSLKKTQQFIEVLKEHGHNVMTKTLREKWNVS